jgi:hypothetical protein
MSTLPNKKIINIDFDNTVSSYASGWTRADQFPDPPHPGAIEALRDDYRVVGCVCITTSRFNIMNQSECDGISSIMDAMVAWFARHGIPPAMMNRDGDWNLDEDKINLCVTKPPANVSLDDRGVPFAGVWPSGAALVAFRPWNKRSV